MNPLIVNYSDIFKYEQWEGQDKFSDGTLYTDDGTQFPIHRVILSRSSEYFRGLFSFDSSRNIKLFEIDGKIMEHILIFIYTGQAALTQENVWALMIASDYLLVDDLVRECRSFAVRNLNVGNCLSAMATAFKIDKLSLFQDCLRFATVHFEKIVGDKMTDLEQVPFEILSMLLWSDTLNVSTERTVWMAIVRWVTSDTENRLSFVPQLLASIRMRNQELEQDLAREIVTHDIVRKNPYGLMNVNVPTIFESESWHFLRQEVNHQLKELGLPQRSASDPRLPRCLYFMARHLISQNKLGSELFLTVDERLDWFRRLGDVPFFAEVALVLGHTLYLFNTMDNTSSAYDVVEETWTQMSQPVMDRYNYSVVTLGGCLYAIGGHLSNYELTDLIECYDPDDEFWYPVRPMTESIASGTVVYDDRIIVIGHTFDGEAPAMICQVYDADGDLWTTVSPPVVPRTGFSAVVYGSSVIVTGGESDSGYVTSVEQYNPETDTWESLPDLPFAYITPKAVVVEDKLLVFDNNHEDTRFCNISPPVIWNTDYRAWEVIDKSSPFHGIERHTFCKIEDRNLVEILTLKNRSPNVSGFIRE